MPIFETIAVIFGTLYLLLAMRENPLGWIAGLISTAILSVLFFNAHLYMESVLQLYYVTMAVYGWQQWQGTRAINTWTRYQHLAILAITLMLSATSSLLLSRYTDAHYPFLDSFVTWGSLIATYMATRKILENWLYWIVLDTIAIYCYLNKALFLTAGLYAFYAILALIGYIHWFMKRRTNYETVLL